ncbi:MAG: hypothetical protein AB7T37_09440 [Dehalococcoidia bacterium]
MGIATLRGKLASYWRERETAMLDFRAELVRRGAAGAFWERGG